MDIDYLLLLQHFREASHDIFSPFLVWYTDFASGIWSIIVICMIYWVFDRNAGKRIFAGLCMGALANGFLKLIFRITRPWIRDDRVLPYGDSKVTATGYSFPSGHATFATAILGGVSWWQRKRNKLIALFFFVAMLLVLFSRNYLGVHTPQDVFVGTVTTILMMVLANKIENWTDQDIKRDWIVMVVGLAICGVLVLFYQSIPIKQMYDEAGTLIVDPAKMKADSFEGIGMITAYVICRCFERRCFDFDTKHSKKTRFVICIFAMIPLVLWDAYIADILDPISRSLRKYMEYSGIITYTFIVVPWIMTKIKAKNRRNLF